jgi:Fur family transcriptional regulator, ferric uptake regulator
MHTTRQLGQRQTAQRAAIMAAITASHGPMTVNEIHADACQAIPNLGVATVYRTLKLLLDAEELHAVVLDDGQPRYESARLAHHHHFRCNVCRSVYDLPGCPMSTPNGIALPAGFTIEGHEITLYGTCPACDGAPA